MENYYSPNFDNQITAGAQSVSSWWTGGGPENVLFIIKVIVVVFSLGLIFMIIYSNIRISELDDEIKKRKANWKKNQESGTQKKNNKWELILANLAQDNEASWRLAIIEADLILDELLRNLVPGGGTIGDKLKTINKTKMANLDNAWEAHKIRNRIAHDGSDFHISRPEARRTIEMYGDVFREFDLI